MTRSNYWSPVESQWRAENLIKIEPFLAVTIRTHDMVARIAQHSEILNAPSSNQLKVERLLLRRLGEELRALELLAENGHGYQAVSAASNLFEQCYFLTYISLDSRRAETFLTWDKPYANIMNIKRLLEETGARYCKDKKSIEEEYNKYRLLCGFKHNNALFQKFLTLPNPDLLLSQFALAHGNWLVLTTIALYAEARLTRKSFCLELDTVDALTNKASALFSFLPNLLTLQQAVRAYSSKECGRGKNQ